MEQELHDRDLRGRCTATQRPRNAGARRRRAPATARPRRPAFHATLDRTRHGRRRVGRPRIGPGASRASSQGRGPRPSSCRHLHARVRSRPSRPWTPSTTAPMPPLAERCGEDAELGVARATAGERELGDEQRHREADAGDSGDPARCGPRTLRGSGRFANRSATTLASEDAEGLARPPGRRRPRARRAPAASTSARRRARRRRWRARRAAR